MTEAKNEDVNPGSNPFDDDNFVVSSALNGVTGKVTLAEFAKKAGKTPEDGEYTILRVVVEAEGLDKPRELQISGGAVEPSKDGETKDVVGPFFTGKVNKTSNLAAFLSALKASGFPMAKMAKSGAAALEGALITFKAVESKFYSKKDKKEVVSTKDLPAAFVGFDGEVAVAVEDLSELKATIGAAIKEAVEAAGGVLPRGQLSAKLAPVLKDIPNKSKALGLLVDESFLASIEGVGYDKKQFTVSGS